MGPDLDGHLYECWTTAGEHVYLGDMLFKGFAYAATPSPQLRVSFDWGEVPVPPSYAGPVVEFSFDDARILRWEDQLVDDEDRQHLGQENGFDYTSDGIFALQTYTVWLIVSAAGCRLETRA